MENANEPTVPDRRGEDHPQQQLVGLDRRRPLMRMDFTLNIPTMLAIISMVGAIGGTGLTFYSNLKEKQLTTDFEIAKLAQRMDKAEGAMTLIKTDQVQQQATLRAEMKGDISEIKEMLNRLIFSNPGTAPPSRQQHLNEWRR